MPSRLQIAAVGLAAAAAIAVTTAVWQRSAPAARPVPVAPEATHGPEIDVVFAIDTTASMDALLDSARRTMWSIATHVRQLEPRADLRFGLVAYRDIDDAYVTRPFALTGDLDAVYAELADYTAEGGGDIPENVDAALAVALELNWRRGATRLVFVVGDAPPASRGDVPAFDVLARRAAARGIAINAIRCGGDPRTAESFERLAALGGGAYASIPYDGGVPPRETPYDARVVALAARLDRTPTTAAVAAAPVAVQADRAAYHALGTAPRELADVIAQREAYLAGRPGGPAGAFDTAVVQALATQLQRTK